METIGIMKAALAAAIGYLLGAVPFAYIIARARKGLDIRRVGSGNVGALAVWREVGPLWGVVTLVGDVGKGALAVGVARWLGLGANWECAAGFAAICGHNWPVFLKLRGGRGAATTMGVLLVLLPLQLAIALGVSVVIIIATSNVRLGMVGLATTPLSAWLFHKPPVYIYYSLFLVLFLAFGALLSLKKELAKGGGGSLLVDRNYHFWQTRKGR